jgi:hypothetical protein
VLFASNKSGFAEKSYFLAMKDEMSEMVAMVFD